MKNFFNTKNKAALLSMLLVLSAGITACGSEQASNAPVETEAVVTTAAQETEPESEASKLQISIDSALIDDTDIANALVAEFPEYEIIVGDVEAHYSMDTAEYNSNVTTVLSRNIEEIARDKESGKFADITDIAAKRGYLDNLSDEAKALFTDENGRIYAIPSPYTYSLALMCNTDLFVEAGLTDDNGAAVIPSTWDEVVQAAKTINEKTGKAGLVFIGQKDVTASWHFLNLAYNFGSGDLCAENDNGYTSNINSEAAVAAMESLKNLKWQDNVLTANPEEEDFYSIIEKVSTGEAAMCISATDCISLFTGLGLSGEKLAVASIPSANGTSYTLINGSAIAFSADASEEEIEAALDCVEYLGYTAAPDDLALAGINKTLTGEFVDAFTAQNITTSSAVMGSDLYLILAEVINNVMTDENADVAALMANADASYNAALNN